MRSDASPRSSQLRDAPFITADVETIGENVRSGRWSPLAVVDAFQTRIAKINPKINAIVDYDPEEGRRQARELAARLDDGEAPPLAGVPIVVKDVIWVAGRRVTQGSPLFREFRPPHSALCVERLRQAGAIIIGMGNSSEFACKGNTTNLVYGATRNPLDLDLTPGGSSGGSAAAVAADMAPIALGTDAGGSARRPPAHVGVVGFKPSYGAVAHTHGFAPIESAVDTIAPIGRRVADVRRLFAAIVGPDPRDPRSIYLPPPEPRPPRDWRLAFSPCFGLDASVDEDVEIAIWQTIRQLRDAGWTIRQADPVWPEGATEAAIRPILQAEIAAAYGEAFRQSPDLFDPEIGRLIENGLSQKAVDVARARSMSAAIAAALARFFEKWDLLMTPTTPCVAWPVNEIAPRAIGGKPASNRGHAVFTPFVNHALAPAASIPCGAGKNGLPVGLQIIGPRFRDERVLCVAAAVEKALGDAARPWRPV